MLAIIKLEKAIVSYSFSQRHDQNLIIVKF